MKCIIELNSSELIKVISNGTLLKLAEATSEADEAVKVAGEIIDQEQPKKETKTKSKKKKTQTAEPQPQPEPQPEPQPPPVQQNTIPTAPPVQQQPVQQTVVPTAPPVQQPEPQPVPAQTPTYKLSDIQLAAQQLMDAGKQQELRQLLADFGVQALVKLPPEQYANFATQLRMMGARI